MKIFDFNPKMKMDNIIGKVVILHNAPLLLRMPCHRRELILMIVFLLLSNRLAGNIQNSSKIRIFFVRKDTAGLQDIQ